MFEGLDERASILATINPGYPGTGSGDPFVPNVGFCYVLIFLNIIPYLVTRRPNTNS